ncbi:MAG: RNA pseudouridine synthase [Clostridiales bacterium GWE2_32_10]|nr:MAG: RNA pseudouridine synthase [Clostridiales bacterium GWE2_32_10]HBY21497.1 RNA pseudouridine synthase [Clostridiales bacterium]
MQEYRLVVQEYGEGERIDKYISEQFEEYSREYIKKLIINGKVKVNDKDIKQNYKVKLNDEIFMNVPEPTELEILPEDIHLDIIYEDDDIIVINKAQGMVVHPAPGNYTGTLVNALLYHCKGNLSQINGVLRPGIVHRIDKETSGVMVVAKNNVAHTKLAEQFKEHTINRKYHAIVYNNFIEDKGIINLPIGRHPVDRIKMTVTDRNSRHAVTHYKVLERFGDFTYIECKLETGRTHQIRAHMAHKKHPLLGDEVYGPSKQPYNLRGQTLHAKLLGFIHPKTNEYMVFESELPEYFMKLLDKIRAK